MKSLLEKIHECPYCEGFKDVLVDEVKIRKVICGLAMRKVTMDVCIACMKGNGKW